AVPTDASDPTKAGYQAMCKARGGDRPVVEGTLPVLCRSVPKVVTDEALVRLADEAEVRVVVLVGYGVAGELEVQTTEHHRGNALLARLDGLPLPREPEALAMVAPVLKAVAGANTASGATGAT